MRIFQKIACLGLTALLLAGLNCSWAMYRQTQLASRLIRLHVVANSDSDADQALKLEVRDAVLRACALVLEEAEDRSGAWKQLTGELPMLAEAGSQTVSAAGYSYPVTVKMEYTAFPRTEYEDFSLPAGRYQALRVEIGEAEGHNWWCVIFPSLCLEPVSELSETAMAEGLTEEDISLITQKEEGYELRFRCIELWEELISRIREAGSETP